MDQLDYNRKIDINNEVDVFVAGGGPAGISAAVTAVRTGAKVFLAESCGCFGGMGTSGLVPWFCQFADGENFLAGGIGRQVYEALYKLETDWVDTKKQDSFCELTIDAEALKRIYDEMLLESGVNISLCTSFLDVHVDNNVVTAAICSGKSGVFAVKAKVFIDCTGDGDLFAKASVGYVQGDVDGNMQPGTLCSLWTDIDWGRAAKHSRAFIKERLVQAIDDGVFEVADYHLPGIIRTGPKAGGGNVGHAFGVDATDEVSLTKALISSRRRLKDYEYFYRKYVPGFEKMRLAVTGSVLGVRESRRLAGKYILKIEDFENRANFEDEIGRYCYRVDLHSSNPDKSNYAQFKKDFDKYTYAAGESYGIPYRSLVSLDLKNLLVAGRCISADRLMHSSIRVMPCCFITGQAAGMAASIATAKKSDVRDVEIEVLQKKLKGIGAFLPNC